MQGKIYDNKSKIAHFVIVNVRWRRSVSDSNY